MKTHHQYQTPTITEGRSAVAGARRTTSHREQDRRANRLAATVGTDYHVDQLWALRESDAHAQLQLADLMDYVLRPAANHGNQAAADILAHGIALVQRGRDGDALRAQYGAKTIYGGYTGRKVIGWVLEHEGQLFLLSLFSAAKSNDRESNDYTDALAELIERHTVAEVHTGPFSRLVRSKDHANRVREAGKRAGTTIYAYGRMPADLSTETGRELWDRMVDEAVWDYNLTVERLTRGGHALLMAGQYPKDEAALPGMGYTFRENTLTDGQRSYRADRTPVPALDQIDVVRDLLTWGATDMTNEQIAQKLADVHGWGSATLRARLGDPAATVMQAEYPGTVVKNLWRHLDLWATGTYVYSARVPVSAEKVRTDVAEVSYKSGGQVRMEVPLDFHHELLPGGAWVDVETLRQCFRRRWDATQVAQVREAITANSARLPQGYVDTLQDLLAGDHWAPVQTPTGRAAGAGARKPLSGCAEWVDGPHQYTLSARHRTSYTLLRRDASDAYTATGRARGWRFETAELVALINPAEVHTAIAEALVQAIDADGVQLGEAVRLASGDDPAETGAALAAARKAARIADLTYAAAVELYADEETEANALGVRQALAGKNAAQLQLREAEDRNARAGLGVTITATVGIDATDIALTLATLANTEGQAPADLNAAVRNLLHELTFQLSEDGTQVHGSVSVNANTAEGPVVLGPVGFTVRNRQYKTRPARWANLLASYLRDGVPFEEAAAKAGYTDIIAARRRCFKELQATGCFPSKGRRAAIMDCPVPATRKAIWAELEARRNQKPAPTGAWAALIRATYFDNAEEWTLAWCADNPAAARAAVAAAKTAGKRGMPWEDLVAIIEQHAGSVRTLAEELVRGKRGGYAPVLERSEHWHRHADRTVWARQCPYCGTRTVTHVLRVPEVPGGMLCTKCRHAPELPDVQYPTDYLRQWAGPRGHGTGKGGTHKGTVEL